MVYTYSDSGQPFGGATFFPEIPGSYGLAHLPFISGSIAISYELSDDAFHSLKFEHYEICHRTNLSKDKTKVLDSLIIKHYIHVVNKQSNKKNG